MTLPTKDQIIEVMALAIINQAEYSIAPEKRMAQLRAQQPYWNDVAKAALQAMLAMLPEITRYDTYGEDNNGCSLYEDLLEMREAKGDNDANITK